MAGFSLSPGRARAARITSALALMLALAAVFGGATASAAPSTTELTCGPDEPLAGSTVTCKVVVTGAEASRTLRFDQIGFAEFKPRTCTLLPLNKTSVFCVARFKVLAPGRLTVFASYLSATEENFSSDSHDFLVKPGGSIRVECSPEFGFLGELSDCEVVVPNTPGVSEPPSGLVQFRSLSEVLGEPAGRVTPECTLEPTPSGARCSLRFEPFSAGTVALIAEYEGDASHPAQFGSVPYLVFEKHETTTGVKCDTTTPLVRTRILCTATVVNQDETGGPPTGTVDFRRDDSEHINLIPGSCRLEAEDEKSNESSCSIGFESLNVARHTLEAAFLGSEHFDFGLPASIELDVVAPRKTSTALTCLPSRSSFSGVCLATVTDSSASPLAPSGTVRLNAPETVKSNRETCLLAPTTSSSSSSCAFSYTMTAIGSTPVVAEYSGDDKGHLPSSGKGTASRQS
ncbi:MAG TPA: hypothetical protein VMS60_12210 [Solirubrobacterales bacterium]|nr:hypothetical protein [Solirubrobacterales bacterium]